MGRVVKYAITIIVLLATAGQARVIHIPSDYANIQAGINASHAGDTVQVASGTYTGNGNRNIDFLGKSILLESAAGPDSTILNIQGSIQNPYRGFYFHRGEDSTAVLKGLTIRAGFDYSSGGNIYCSGSSPTIIDCYLTNGHSDNNGGGIYCENGASPKIRNCVFSGNFTMGSSGGAIYCENTSVDIRDCRFTRNTTVYRGGAIALEYASGIIEGCQIDSNFAIQGGGISLILCDSLSLINCVIRHDTTDSDAGGVYCQGGWQFFFGCSFIDNRAMYGAGLYGDYFAKFSFQNCSFIGNISYQGAGLALGGMSETAILKNCVFYANSAAEGAGIYVPRDAEVNVANTIISLSSRGDAVHCLDQDADITLSYCDLFGNVGGNWVDCVADQMGIRGNISFNPYFRNGSENDFHLKSIACGYTIDSPCIDSGNPNDADSLLDCSWGLGTALCDMGAYGGGDSAISAIESESGVIPDEALILRNYPNPLNATTIIQYNLPERSFVTLEIYDIAGRFIETLVKERQNSGSYKIAWNADRLSSGIYLCRIKTDKTSQIRKLLIVR